MSAKSAAASLLKNDITLAEFAAKLQSIREIERREYVINFLRENVMNTWTLTLVADAAGCTEEQVIAALLKMEPLRIGTACVCAMEARACFRPKHSGN